MASTINDIITALAGTLRTSVPGSKVYIDKLPQSFSKKSFYIQVYDHQYGKRISNKFNATASFDVSYFSDSTTIETDCHTVAETVMRELDLVGTYRIGNKTSRITDDVLHIVFDIHYSEINIEAGTLMQEAEISPEIKEE